MHSYAIQHQSFPDCASGLLVIFCPFDAVSFCIILHEDVTPKEGAGENNMIQMSLT